MKGLLRRLRFIWTHPLASRNRPTALWLWLRWQIGSRILRHPVVVPFVGTAVLVVERGMTGATGNIYCGLHEFADMALALHFLRPEDLFLDIGANIGSYTVLAAKVAGAKCLAVEPVPATFGRLCRNLKINGLEQQVEARQYAVGNFTGCVRFSVDMDTMNHVVDKNYAGASLSVPVCTMDELLGDRSSAMWKVDVEGFERQVLQGAGRALLDSKLKIVLLESDDDELSKIMSAAGFVRCGYDAFLRRVEKTARNPQQRNNLWIRDTPAVQARCQTAPKQTVLGIEF